MARILPTNDTNTVPGAIVIVEVATHKTPDKLVKGKVNHTLRSWSSVAGRMENGKWTREKHRTGMERSDFWQWVNFARQSGHPTTICGSAVGRSMSLLGLWGLLESGEYSVNLGAHPDWAKCKSSRGRAAMRKGRAGLLITDGPPTAFILYHKDRWKLTVVDVQNYLDKTPAELAALSGLPYTEWSTADVTDDECSRILDERANVTAAVFRKLVTWQNQQELGMFSLTISSLAMAAFRHRFMRDSIELPEEQDERDFERTAYYNGRVEPLWSGRIAEGRYYPVKHAKAGQTLFDPHPVPPFHVLDSRSFYAAVATYESLPVACTENHLDLESTPPQLDESVVEVMASVQISCVDNVYPVRAGAGAIHARGTFQTTLCGPELLRAVMAGHVTKWFGWRRYRLGQPLRWYATGLWEERCRAEREGDKIVAALCKSLLARIHGKFLQRAHRWTLLPGRQAPGPWECWESIDVVKGIRRLFRSIGWDVQIRDDAGDASHCFPALAAWVTAHGREYLRHWMQVAGKGHVLYVGCDSLIVDDTGLENLTRAGIVWPDGVGSLRVVRTANDIEIRGPNNYSHGDRDVVSGRAMNDLVVKGKEWTAKRWQGVEEVFLAADKSTVSTFAMSGDVRHYNAVGSVGAGGWIEPPTLSIREQEECLNHGE